MNSTAAVWSIWILMMCIGLVGAGALMEFVRPGLRRTRIITAWLIFWIAPPLVLIWTKGVMG